MKLNKVLNESLIDDLKIHKIHKSIMKRFNDENTTSPNDVYEISKEYGTSLHDAMVLFNTYLKYKDILFSEQGVEFVKEYDVFSKEKEEITRRILLDYIDKNYKDKTIYDNNGVTGFVELWEPVDIMVEESMGPSVYVQMPVNGTYTDSDGKEYSGDDVNFRGGINCNIMPWVTKDGKQRMGYDFIAYNEEVFGDWQNSVINNQRYELVSTGYLNTNVFGKPKNYSEEEIKKYIEKWVTVQQRIIQKSLPLLLEYKDYVESGGSLFGESINRR